MPKDRKKTRIVGDYELFKNIGEGAFSTVWKAKNKVTNEDCAVKILSKEKIDQQNMGAQIKKEISILKLIHHPNIVQVHEIVASKTRIFVVQELVDGGEVFDRIVESKRLSEKKARYWFQQMCIAIEYCHRQGICHRDLKPENLLLDKNDNLKITDFGLSALLDLTKKNNFLRTSCGTPNYVAPEVIENRGYDGIKSDTWSIGVVLFVFCAGFLPFDEPNMKVLFRKIKKADYYIPRWFSDNLIHLLSKILMPNPQRRFTITDITQHKWWRLSGPLKDIAATNNLKPTQKELDEKPVETQSLVASQYSNHREELKKNIFASTLSKDVALVVLKSNLEQMDETVHVVIEDERLKGELNFVNGVLKIRASVKEVNKKPLLNMIVLKKVTGSDRDFKALASQIETFMD